MRHSIQSVDGNGTTHFATVESSTMQKINKAVAAGAHIIINTNWQFKGQGYSKVDKLSQTNDRKHGKPKHIVWACYK